MVAMPTDREALQARQQAGERLKFRFFWGHSGAGVGPWVLSQWWEAPFTVAGASYPTAEHWMMAEKARFFGDEASACAILAARSPGVAKALGRKVADFDEEEWARVRSAVVRTGNLEKFRQSPTLAEWLLGTGDVVLVEASPRDRIWGIGMGADHASVERVAEWRGENLLGFALVEVRRRLREYPSPQLPPGFLRPPWLHLPDAHPASIGWRMGSGEAYIQRFTEWWAGLGEADRIQVEMLHPATGAWAGWYDP